MHFMKSMKRLILSLFIWSMVFSFVLVSGAWADSTIGSNISTTGTLSTTSTFTVTNGSATGVRFQNAAGTNLLVFDHASTRLGIGGTPTTTFEVQGTASVSYFLSANAVQFASIAASVAYSRFGSTTTNHANYISASNDLLVSGDTEIRGSASFGGTASVSGMFFMNDGRFRPNANSATAFRFQNANGATDVLTIDTTSTRVGVNAGGAVDTTFEVGGTASISGLALFGGNASIAGNFELTATSPLFGINSGGFIDTTLEVGGTASVSGKVSFGGSASVSDRFELTSTTARFGINAGTFTDTALEVGGVASVGTNFNVGENSTATTSATFETRSAIQGACFTITGSDGIVYYARIVASGSDGDGAWWVTTKNCNLP